MVDRYVSDNGVRRLATADELAEINARETAWSNDASNRKLAEIKQIRLKKLKATDWMAMADLTISDAWKTKRQSWRDIPQNNSTEAEYDAILERDANGVLTNAIWSDA
jgi:hypothetical protein